MNTSSTQPKRSRALTVLQFLNGFLYGLVVLFGFFVPLGFALFGAEEYRDFATALLTITIVLLGMVALGMELMRWASRALTDKAAVEVWTMSALLIAPFSGCFHLMFCDFLYQRGSAQFAGWSLSAEASILIFMFGFFLTFLLLTLWVRYRYRSDEFQLFHARTFHYHFPQLPKPQNPSNSPLSAFSYRFKELFRDTHFAKGHVKL